MQARIVEAHRDLRCEVLQLVPGEPELREHDEVGATCTRLVEQLVMAGEVCLERAEAGRGLGEGDPDRLHPREHTRPYAAGARHEA